MKPSEWIKVRVSMIREKLGGKSPTDWTTAIIEYLDEQAEQPNKKEGKG